MRSPFALTASLATLAVALVPTTALHAAPRNWVDRYIAANGHCTQQPMVLTTAPLDKPIEEWTDGDLADLKAALDRCDALPDAQSGVSRLWTGKLYDVVVDLVRDRQRYAAQQEEIKQAARDRAEQAEGSRQRRIAADKEAAKARLAALQRAAEQEAAERKAVEERTAATAEELKAAAKLADETEARAKAARAEAQARSGVEAAKQRAAQAEEQARNADAQARAERAAADKRFADVHPAAIAPAPRPQASETTTIAGIERRAEQGSGTLPRARPAAPGELSELVGDDGAPSDGKAAAPLTVKAAMDTPACRTIDDVAVSRQASPPRDGSGSAPSAPGTCRTLAKGTLATVQAAAADATPPALCVALAGQPGCFWVAKAAFVADAR